MEQLIDDHRCPHCGRRCHAWPRTNLRRRLEAVGAEWTVVRLGASRSTVHKLRARYPDLEWRHTRHGDHWTIEARRPAP